MTNDPNNARSYENWMNDMATDVDDRPREWVESEESMRGAPLQEVLRSQCVTVIWHRARPKTTNPVWEVIGNDD